MIAHAQARDEFLSLALSPPADITPKAKPGLIELGVALRSDDLKGALFLVSRHTDASGPDDYNQSLSERRAESVMRFLTERFAVPPDQILAIGYGEEQHEQVDLVALTAFWRPQLNGASASDERLQHPPFPDCCRIVR